MIERVLRGPLGWRVVAVAAPIGLGAFVLWTIVDISGEDRSVIWDFVLVVLALGCGAVAVRMWRSCVRVAAHDLRLVGIFRTRRIEAAEIQSFDLGDFLGNRAIVVVTERSCHLLPPMSQQRPSKVDSLREWLNRWREAAVS